MICWVLLLKKLVNKVLFVMRDDNAPNFHYAKSQNGISSNALHQMHCAKLMLRNKSAILIALICNLLFSLIYLYLYFCAFVRAREIRKAL